MIDKNAITNAAQKFASRGQIDEAISEWKKILTVNQDGNVYNTIGDLYLKKREQEKAIESFEKAANIFREDGFYPKAIALFKKILNIASENVSALIGLSQLNAERGFTKQAVNELQKVADIFISRNNFEKGMEVYERILQLTPNNIAIKIKKAELTQKAGKTQKACQGYVAVAADYLEKGEVDQAERYYEEAMQIDPQNSGAIIGLSNLYDRTGNTKKALQYLNQAVSANPEDHSIMHRYARLCIKEEKIDEAKRILLNLTENDSSNLDAKKLLGIIYNDEGLIEEAWGELQPCIDDAISYNNWTDALAMLNNFEEVNSMPVIQRFVDIYRGNGDHASLLIHIRELGALLESKESHSEALELYKEALAIRPDDTEMNEKVNCLEGIVSSGTTYEAGDKGQNTEPAARDKGDFDQYLEIKKTEADFYAQQGLHDEAIKIYEELLESYPDRDVIMNAMTELKAAADSGSSCYQIDNGHEPASGDINSAMNEILQEAEMSEQDSGNGDYDAHFQKGIEFRRLGQIDDAINELQKASSGPENLFRNLRMLAMCYIDQGNYSDAIDAYEKAVDCLTPDDTGFLDIKYELADAYMNNGDRDKALASYAEISRHDATFRDVAQKIESIGSCTEMIDEEALEDSEQASIETISKNNRISYL